MAENLSAEQEARQGRQMPKTARNELRQPVWMKQLQDTTGRGPALTVANHLFQLQGLVQGQLHGGRDKEMVKLQADHVVDRIWSNYQVACRELRENPNRLGRLDHILAGSAEADRRYPGSDSGNRALEWSTRFNSMPVNVLADRARRYLENYETGTMQPREKFEALAGALKQSKDTGCQAAYQAMWKDAGDYEELWKKTESGKAVDRIDLLLDVEGKRVIHVERKDPETGELEVLPVPFGKDSTAFIDYDFSADPTGLNAGMDYRTQKQIREQGEADAEAKAQAALDAIATAPEGETDTERRIRALELEKGIVT